MQIQHFQSFFRWCTRGDLPPGASLFGRLGPFLAKHNIDPSIILPGNLVYGAVNDGKLYLLLIAILVYVVAAVMISARAFENKELEF